MSCRMKYLLELSQMMKKIKFLFFLLFATNALLAAGQGDIPAKPNGYVLDAISALKPEERNLLEQKLRGYADTTSTQFAVVLVPSTGGRDAYDYAMEIGKSWGIGQKGKNNGVVILVSMDDRKIRIVTGRGIEDVLTDAICKRIINRILKPYLKQGDFYGGLDLATTEMMQRASGEFKADASEDSQGIPLFAIIIIAFVLITLINAYRNRNRNGGSGPGSTGGGGMFFPPIFLGGGNYGGGSGGSGGGGFDFGGFGGGDFGGGGAGGDF